MSEELKTLETQRDQLYQQIASLGDFRLGSISTTFSKCGKKSCVCANKDHPGHGPHYRWTATRKGKSRAQHLRLGSEVAQVQEQIENGKRFQAWYLEAIELNEKISRLRPVSEIEDKKELENLKKKLRRKYLKK